MGGRSAVRAAHQPLLLEHFEITPDRCLRDGELLGERDDVDGSLLDDRGDDLIQPLLAQHVVRLA